MKKRFFSLFLCAALLLSIACPAHTAWADTSSDDGGIYTDPETGATFVVPDGWQESKLAEGSLGPFEVQFITQNKVYPMSRTSLNFRGVRKHPAWYTEKALPI